MISSPHPVPLNLRDMPAEKAARRSRLIFQPER